MRLNDMGKKTAPIDKSKKEAKKHPIVHILKSFNTSFLLQNQNCEFTTLTHTNAKGYFVVKKGLNYNS